MLSQTKSAIVRRKLYAHRRKLGLCFHCNKPAMPGITYCKHHQELHAAAARRRRKRRQESGLCRECDAPALPGRTTCEDHLWWFLNYWKDRRERWARTRACHECGNTNNIPGHLCPSCLNKKTQYTRMLRQRPNTCPRCGLPLDEETMQMHRKTCFRCLEREALK